MSEKKSLILVTNRFDNNLRHKLSQIEVGEFKYVSNIFEDASLLEKAVGIITRSSTQVDTDFLNKAKSLKFLVTATSGFDHIDLNAAQAKGVRVFHVPETQSVAAAELTIMMIFASARKWTLVNKQIQKGDWQRSLLLGKQVAGQSLGIVGLGRVGTEVAKRAMALGLTVSAFDPFINKPLEGVAMLGFEEMMRSSDIISLHVPKTKKTRHMIKKETLGWMNTEATLINMSRGDVINESDLIDHLIKNSEFSAGLDVFAKEPLVTQSKLLSLSNVCLSPHVGASTVEALANSSQKALDKVCSLLKGEAVEGELPPKAPWYEG